MSIYIAGPVLRPTTRQPNWVTACYELVKEVVYFVLRDEARFPVAEPLLEPMDAPAFASEVARRIASADRVIAVFLPDDQSTPIECALAASARKHILLLHQAGTRIPRILAGLPGVRTAVYGRNTKATIESFLRD